MDSLLKSQTQTNNDDITDVVDLNAPADVIVAPKKPAVLPSNEAMETDYEIARRNLKELVEDGREALKQLLMIADASQHPRSYEVVATLIKTLAETNQELMTLAKKRHDINNANGEDAKEITNNNIFVGSTAELQKLIKNAKNGQ